MKFIRRLLIRMILDDFLDDVITQTADGKIHTVLRKSNEADFLLS
jgi:hypothetical protein